MMYAEMKDGVIQRTQHFVAHPGGTWVEYAEPPVALTREDKKIFRETAVEQITVFVGGKEFDGDETSQNRMARAVIAMQAAGAPSIMWVLANNVPTLVTVSELVQALALAGQKQADMWVIE